MKRFFEFLCVYFSINVIIIKDSSNNSNYYLGKYLNCLTLLKLPPFNLELKVEYLILFLQSITLHQ